MTGLYFLLTFAIFIGIVNLGLLVGLGLFLLKFANSIKENRQNVADAIEDITDMVRLMRGNFEDLKNFIRSLV